MTRGGWEPVNHSIQDFWPESSLRSQNRITTYFYLRNQTAAFSDVSSNASLAPHLGVYSTHTLGFHTSHSQLQAENEYLKPVYGFNVSSTFFPKKLFITSTSIWISRKNPGGKTAGIPGARAGPRRCPKLTRPPSWRHSPDDLCDWMTDCLHPPIRVWSLRATPMEGYRTFKKGQSDARA